MRIVLVLKMPLSNTGGAEVSTRHLIDAVVRRGHVVEVVTGVRKRSVGGACDVLTHALTRRPRERIRRHSFVMRSSVDPIRSLRSLLVSSTPDAVVVTGTDPGFARGALEAASAHPTVLFIRVEAGLSVPHHTHIDAVATNSEYMADRARALGWRAIHVPSLFPVSAYRVPGSGDKVLFVNPIPKKGVEIAIDLAQRRPDIPFVFNRSWRMEPRSLRRLRRQVRALPNVEIRAATVDPRHLFRDCRLLLVPSQCDEAWGRVVSEAHVNGIPVVASDAGGLREAVGPGGLLVHPRDDRGEWLRAVSRVWDDAETYAQLSVAARGYSERTELSEEYVVDRFEEAISDAIVRHTDRDSRLHAVQESISPARAQETPGRSGADLS